MRKYELMTIYPLEDEKYKAGLDTLRDLDAQFKFNTNLLKYLFVLVEEKKA